MTASSNRRGTIRWMGAALGVLLACAAPDAPAAAQTRYAPEPVVLLVVPDSSGGEQGPRRSIVVRGRQPPLLHSFTRHPSGRIYLTASGIPAAVFTPGTSQGSHLRTAPGHGAFGGSLNWLGDTLAVGGFQTWQLLRADGTPLECRAFEQMNNEFATQVFPRQALAGGLTLGELTPAYPDPRFTEDLVVSRGQTVIRTLHRRPSGPYYVDVPFPWGGGAMSVVVPYTAGTLWTASDDGAHVVVVESEQPASPGPHPVRVLRMDLEGRTAYDVRLLLSTRPVREDEREREIGEWATHMASGTTPRDTAAAARAFREKIAFPAYHPAVTEVRVAGDGAAWLRLAEEDGAVWLRIGPDGAAELRMAVDGSFRAKYADVDALWGAVRGTDGSLRVVAYPLPGRPPLFPAGFAGFAPPAGRPSFPDTIIRGEC